MLKVGSKRRRTATEVKVEREDSKMKAGDLQAKLTELRAMDQQLKQKKAEFDSGQAAANILNGLIKAGQIVRNGDGSFAVPGGKK